MNPGRAAIHNKRWQPGLDRPLPPAGKIAVKRPGYAVAAGLAGINGRSNSVRRMVDHALPAVSNSATAICNAVSAVGYYFIVVLSGSGRLRARTNSNRPRDDP